MLGKKKGYVNLKAKMGAGSIRDDYQFTPRKQVVQYSGRKRKKLKSGSGGIPVIQREALGQEIFNWIRFVVTTALSILGLILVVILDLFHLRGDRNGGQLT